MTPEEQMLICAVRYSLGRMSYIVDVTCEFVASIKEKLSPNCINIIIRDIEETMEMYHRSGNLCGMECDEKDWYRLLEVLKEGDSDEQWRFDQPEQSDAGS